MSMTTKEVAKRFKVTPFTLRRVLRTMKEHKGDGYTRYTLKASDLKRVGAALKEHTRAEAAKKPKPKARKPKKAARKSKPKPTEALA